MSNSATLAVALPPRSKREPTSYAVVFCGASAAPFENAPELISVSASGENDWLNDPYSVSQSSGS